MQLHRYDVQAHQPVDDSELKPQGNEVLLRFQTNEIDAAIKREETLKATFSNCENHRKC